MDILSIGDDGEMITVKKGGGGVRDFQKKDSREEDSPIEEQLHIRVLE